MSEIILFLPGNIFHSNVTQEKMERMLAEKAGMEALRDSNVPLVFGWQRLDELLAADIYDPGRHELCAGSLTHVLHSRLTPERSAWQTAKGIADSRWQKGQGSTSIDVTFYPEFAPPFDPELIPTKYFFLPAPQTVYYDYDPTTGTSTLPQALSQKVPAIRFGSKVGILIHNRILINEYLPEGHPNRETRDPIRDQWHKYQNKPTRENLDALVQATRSIADQDGQVHITLLDLETPYVGGAKDASILWNEYFEALGKDVENFSKLEPHLSWFDKQAVDIESPHRMLDKWTRHDAQLDYIRRTYDNIHTKTLDERDRWLLAIARSSDTLSAMDSQIRAQKVDTPGFVAKYRKEVIKLGFTCLNILEGKEPLQALATADPLLGPDLLNILSSLPDDNGH